MLEAPADVPLGNVLGQKCFFIVKGHTRNF